MKPKQIPGTGLFVRGTGFDAEQIAGYNRDLKRLQDWIAGKRPTTEEDAAARARAEASERDFLAWDRESYRPRSKR